MADHATAEAHPTRSLGRRLVILAAVCALAWLLWAARSLILPALAAALLAYACRPAVDLMEQRRIPRPIAVAFLVLSAVVLAAGGVHAIRSAAPSAEAIASIQIRLTRMLDKGYGEAIVFARDAAPGGGIDRVVRREADPLVAKIQAFLAKDPGEGAALLEADSAAHPLVAIAHALPAWITAFLLFVFVLIDKGAIKRGIIAWVPNRLFEPVLSIVSDLDKGLRRYAQALFLQCVLLGVTVTATQAIAGVRWQWAVVIGFFAGMGNVMPYTGITIALLGGLAYALLGGEVHSVLPFVDAGNFPLAILAAVLATDAVKNIVYDPMVIGRAMSLHPVVIVLGVAVGAEAFGILGALFAVPVIALGTVLVASVHRQLRAYGEV